jgi:hypothetical protein
MPTFYLDYENGNDAADGSTFALGGLPAVGPWKTITAGPTAARIAPGDIIRIAKSPDPVSVGDGTWTNLSKTVTLAAAQTLTVDLCEIAWTAAVGGDATITLQPVATDAKEGSFCMQIGMDAAPQPSILQAYYPLAGALDLSTYQKLSFWFKNEVAIADATTWLVCLCSDALGAVVVDSFVIPAIPSTARWLPLTIARTGGGNLGNNINSIAIYTGITAPTASKYIRVDDFIACTTDGLNLQSLISKNSLAQGGTEGWYGIQSINGTTVLLDNDNNTLANAGRGYSTTGTSPETVTTYKRETIKTALTAGLTTAVQALQDSGTFGNNIQYQGGYDTTLNTQIGETFFDGLNGRGYGIFLSSISYSTLNYLSVYRYNSGIVFNNSNNNTVTTITNANNNGDSGVFFYLSNNNTVTTITNANNNNGYGVYFNNSNNNTVTTITNANNNNGYGVYFNNSNNNTVTTITNANNNNNGGVYFTSSNNMIKSLSTNGNGVSGGYFNSGGVNTIINFSASEANPVTPSVDYSNSTLRVNKYGGVANTARIYAQGQQSNTTGLIFSQTVTRHTPSGLAWEFQPDSTRLSNYVAPLSLSKVACTANQLVTFKAWMKKDHATNIACQIRLPAYQIAGVTSDVTAVAADNTDWQQLTITFTPTENGVVEILAEAWYVAGDSNAYVHDVSVVGGGRIILDTLGSVFQGQPFSCVYPPDLSVSNLGIGGRKYVQT